VNQGRDRRLVARLWAVPLWAHAVALAAILLVLLVTVVGTTGLFDADEGVAAAQAHQLANGGGWLTPNPFPAVNTPDRYFPFEGAACGTKGCAPYVKHSTYPAALSLGDRVAGNGGLFALSILGTVVAAFFAGLIGRRFAAGAARPTLWLVGLGSPLFFDSYLLIAHALAAGATAIAAWAVLVALDDETSPRRAPLVVIAAVASVAAVVLRDEGLLLVGSVSVVLVATGVGQRRRWPVVIAAAIGVPSLIAYEADRLWAAHVVGSGVGYFSNALGENYNWIEARGLGFYTTWLQPGYGASTAGSALLFLGAALIVVAAVIARTRPRDSAGVQVFAVIGALAFVAGTLIGSARPVPGLFVACPVVFAGFVLLRRDQLRSPSTIALLGGVALFSLAVLLTQYYRGGSGEWGGRYFAIGLPLAAPVVVEALRRARSRIDHATARVAVGALVLVALSAAVLGVRELHDAHDSSAALAQGVTTAAARTPAGDGGAPVVISDNGLVARFAWSAVDRGRWLLVYGNRLDAMYAALAAHGVHQFVLVEQTTDFRAHGGHFGSYAIASTSDPTGNGKWTVARLRIG
jgi:hypothetical protein